MNTLFTLQSIIVCVMVSVLNRIAHCDRIVHYPGVTRLDCGIGRESQQMDDSCFRWHNSHELGTNIQNGRDVRVGEMPWMVKINFVTFNANILWYCSGAILNENWILTCAHCLSDVQKASLDKTPEHLRCLDDNECTMDMYKIFLLNSKGHDDYLTMADWSSYPGYNYTKYTHYDIGLIKLNRAIEFGGNGAHYRSVNSVCLPEANRYNTRAQDEYAIVAGFGSTSNDNTSRLGAAKMGWVKLLKPFGNINDFNAKLIVWRRVPYPNGTVACGGDSGAPLIQYVNGRAVVVSIHAATNKSDNQECSTLDTSLHYSTLVSRYIQWINCTVLGYLDC